MTGRYSHQSRVSDAEIRSRIKAVAGEFAKENKKRVSVRFEWSVKSWICSVVYPGEDALTLIMNLNLCKKIFTASGSGAEYHRLFFCFYLLEQLRLATDITRRVPASYLEGIAFLGRIVDREKKRRRYSALPDIGGTGRGKGDKSLSPEDLLCAVRAAGKVCGGMEPSAPEADREKWEKLLARAAVTGHIPEITCLKSKNPHDILIILLQETDQILRERPELAMEYPMLAGPPLGGLMDMTLEELFREYQRTGNEILGGIAIRLAAYTNGEQLIPGRGSREEAQSEGMAHGRPHPPGNCVDPEVAAGFGRAADVYIQNAVEYIRVFDEETTEMIFGNRIAIDKTVHAVNRIAEKLQPDRGRGTVHPLWL